MPPMPFKGLRWPAHSTKWAVRLSYPTAFASVAVAAAVTLAFDTPPYPMASRFFIAAIVIAARMGGAPAAVLTTLVSVVTLDWYFVGPGVLFENEREVVVNLFTFLLVAAIVSAVTTALRRERELLRKALAHGDVQEGKLARKRERLRRLEARVRETEERFREIADIAPTIMWLCERDGMTSYGNREWERFFGTSVANSRLGFVAGSVHPDDVELAADHSERLLVAQTPSEVMLRLRRRDGEYRWMYVRSAPHFLATSEFAGWVGSAQDVTPWKDAEAQLADVIETKRNFVAVLGHELRTPITAILGYLELVDMDIPVAVPQAAKDELKRVEDAARHLLSLIEALLQFRALEIGAEPLYLKQFPLHAELKRIRAVALPLIQKRGLTLLVDDTYAPQSIFTDPTKFRQIVLNLLTNASKFTVQGAITLRVTQDHSSVVVSVTDPGVGIKAENLQKIWEPFWQVRAAMVREVGGMGIGLAVSQRMAEMLGGTITVDSVYGEGSCFTLTLPK